MEQLFQWLDSFKNSNMVRAAFGEPYSVGDRTLIPVAKVTHRLGVYTKPRAEGERPVSISRSRPVAIVSVSGDGVVVSEIVDRTAVILAGTTLVGLGMLLVWRYLSRRRPPAGS